MMKSNAMPALRATRTTTRAIVTIVLQRSASTRAPHRRAAGLLRRLRCRRRRVPPPALRGRAPAEAAAGRSPPERRRAADGWCRRRRCRRRRCRWPRRSGRRRSLMRPRGRPFDPASGAALRVRARVAGSTGCAVAAPGVVRSRARRRVAPRSRRGSAGEGRAAVDRSDAARRRTSPLAVDHSPADRRWPRTEDRSAAERSAGTCPRDTSTPPGAAIGGAGRNASPVRDGRRALASALSVRGRRDWRGVDLGVAARHLDRCPSVRIAPGRQRRFE